MNLLIRTRDVADFLKTKDSQGFEPHILQAQRQVTGYIRAKSLELRAGIEITYSVDEWTNIVVLRDGPLSTLNAFTLDGAAIDEDDLIVEPWSIQFPGTGSKVVVNYDRGYTLHTVPEDLKSVLIALAGAVNSQPNVDIVYEKIGDYTYQRQSGVPGSQGNQTVYPPALLASLNRYRKPQLA